MRQVHIILNISHIICLIYSIREEVFVMSIKVGINGFGRIGRMVLRCSLQHPEIEIVGINDLCPADYLAYMLKYDTMHGRLRADVSSSDKGIIVNGRSIPVYPVYAERDPANLPWKEIGAEYVIESTGLFLTKEKAAGLEQGVYPFGVCIRTDRSRVFQIFKKKLDAWIAEREE